MIRLGIIVILVRKTFVANNFGYPVFNADYEVSKLYKQDRKIYLKLKNKLPKVFVLLIDKNEIARAIQEDQIILKIINIVHKEIRKKLNFFEKK